jgi:hypothetical protein
MHRTVRKYHRWIAIVICLPLAVTVITGMLASLPEALRLGIGRSVFLKVHNGEILHLEAIYPVLNGLGVLGLLVTGLSLTGLFRKRRQSSSD